MKTISKLILLLCICELSFAQEPTHFTFTFNTGNNALVAIPLSANPNIGGVPLSIGDEIGVFTPSGLCTGAVVWTQQNTVITIWGDDEMTPEIDGMQVGDSIHYRIWKQALDKEYSVTNVSYLLGNGIYSIDGIYILNSLEVTSVNEDKPLLVYNLYQNYPNPFNPKTIIKFLISEYGNVNLKVFDLMGREITTLVDEIKHPGEYEIEFDASKYGLSSGVYLYQLTSRTFKSTKKLVYLR